jgi:hypothetical protein
MTDTNGYTFTLVQFAETYGSGPDTVEYARHLTATATGPTRWERGADTIITDIPDSVFVDLLIHEDRENVERMIRAYLRRIGWSTRVLTDLLCEAVTQARERREGERTTGIGTAGWHPFVVVDGPHGHPVEIDEGIVDLVRWLWAEGFVTVASCQNAEDSGWAWLRFATEAEADKFAGLVEPDREPEADGRDVTFRRGLSLRPEQVVES